MSRIRFRTTARMYVNGQLGAKEKLFLDVGFRVDGRLLSYPRIKAALSP